MSEAAHVTSVEAIARFAVALRQFEDKAHGSLLALDQQINRALHWLEYDAQEWWRQQIRHQFDEVARTRTALETARMRTAAGNRPACIEEQKAHRAAKQRLERATEKLEIVRQSAVRVRHEVDEFRARLSRLKRYLEGDVPRTVALLQRIVEILEVYADGPTGDTDASSDHIERTPKAAVTNVTSIVPETTTPNELPPSSTH